MTKAEAQVRRDALVNDPNSAYWKDTPHSNRHQQSVDEVYELNSILNPEPESRKSELPEMRSTYDAIIKSGIQTPEEIEKIGEEGREKIEVEKSLKEMNAADFELRGFGILSINKIYL